MENKKFTFRFESPAFEQAKEKVRKEYNRITIKSSGDARAFKCPNCGDIIIKKAKWKQ